jgi:hypothetical protein
LYLDLIARKHPEAAREFMERNMKDHKDLHADEILALEAVKSPEHISSNQTASTWRNNRFSILCIQEVNLLLMISR